MPPAKRRPRTPSRAKPETKLIEAIKPIIPAVLKPVVSPVVERLDRHEQLLLDVKSALDVQFQRIADMQAQLDKLLADRHRP